ncbi:MAG: hypothetical protein ABIR83_17030, partial [Nakamurella sp.]
RARRAGDRRSQRASGGIALMSRESLRVAIMDATKKLTEAGVGSPQVDAELLAARRVLAGVEDHVDLTGRPRFVSARRVALQH